MKDLKELLEEATDLIKEDTENISDEALQKLDELQEAISMSMTTRTREAKMNAAIGAISVSIAKEKKDPLVMKMLKYRKLWKETKDQIVKKYGTFAYQRWIKKQGEN
jgi:hypothetical protein